MASKSNSQQSLAEQMSRRAVKKLGPGQWQTTPRSLQQATPWQVADLKATWLGSGRVFDLCCGLGGDAIALAKRGEVVAVDLDQALSELVEGNLRQVAERDRFEVWNRDVTTIPIPVGAIVHIDPDRRAGETRTTDPAFYQPTWAEVIRIVSATDAAIIKLAPTADCDTSELPPSHRCWIALQGTVREQSVLSGRAIDRAGVQAGGRSAVSLTADGTPRSFRPSPATHNVKVPTASGPLRYLVDPNAAIRAARLTEAFAFEHGLEMLHLPTGFLTSDHLDHDAASLAVTGEVIWTGPCDDRRLRRELRALNVYPQTIKVRGSDHDPSTLTKRYRQCGEQPVKLWIGRTGKRVFAAITKLESPTLLP